MRRWFPLILLAVLVFGCGDDEDNSAPANNTFNNARPQNDMGAPEVGTNNASNENNTNGANHTNGTNNTNGSSNNVDVDPTPCMDVLNLDTSFQLDREGRSGQFYSEAVFDGRGVWVAYNRPESEDFDEEAVFVVRLTCDGSVDVGPLQLSEPMSGRRNYSPTIQAYDGNVMVAWVSQATGENPKFVRYVAFGPDGVRLNDENADITPVASGVDPVSETIWEIDLAAYEDGGVVVATALGIEERVVAQRFDWQGARVGDAFVPFENKGISQSLPTVSADPDGTLYMGWKRFIPADSETGQEEVPDRAVVIEIAAGATGAGGATPVPAQPLAAENPTLRFAGNVSPDGEHWLAFQALQGNRSDILVRDGADVQSTRVGVLGTRGWVNFRPNVAAGATLGMVAYQRYQTSPIKTDVVVQSFRSTEVGYEVGQPIVIVDDESSIPPYGPGITHVGDDVFFVTWSAGESAPDARVWGRFVRATSP